MKFQPWPILVLVVLLAVGCSTQADPPPVVEDQTGTEAPATVTVLDEGPGPTVAPVQPTPLPTPTPTETLEPTATAGVSQTLPPTSPSVVEAQVTNVVDGDTIDVQIEGQEYRVRYIGVDTPETVQPTLGAEPYGREASDYNKTLVENQTVFLEKDVSETDQFGRLLRYVWLDYVTMVNALLVAEGYAQVTTFPPDVKYADLFLELEREAREDALGLWGLTPEPVPLETPEPVQGGGCDSSYPTVCIPSPPPPDLDCGEIRDMFGYEDIRVLQPDPHRLDRDNDGIGCES